MAGETSEQAFSTSDISFEELIKRFAKDEQVQAQWQRLVELLDLSVPQPDFALIQLLSDMRQATQLFKLLGTFRNASMHGIEGEKNRAEKNQVTLRIGILEDPLTAQNLSAIITAITDLHARCWFIQQKRLSDLMDYAQTRDPRFVKEANLRVGAMSHNSPVVIDLLVNAGTITGGVATLVLAMTKAIDAVAQTPLRFRAAKLKNEREVLDQKIAAEKAETEKRTLDQERQIAAQKAQIELEKQQLELDRQRFELQKDRVNVVIEIATTTFNQLQVDIDAGQREMIIHSLVPPLLQLASADAIVTTLPATLPNEENKESSENK